MITLAALLACSPGPEPCEASRAFDYAPTEATSLGAWPDDTFTEPDPSSPSGFRVRTIGRPWVEAQQAFFRDLAEQLDGTTGFATQGEIALRFTEAPDVVEGPHLDASGSVALYRVEPDASPTPIPFELRTTDEGRALFLSPLGPLRPASTHIALLRQPDEPERCFAPGPTLLDRLEAGLYDADLLEPLELPWTSVAGLTRFTTHADHEVLFQAAPVASAASGFSAFTCTHEAGYRTCETSFGASDHRLGTGPVSTDVQGVHEVPATWWLPDGPPGPVVVLGHGLGNRRNGGDMRRLARELTARGIAAVAIDHLAHNEHPTALGGQPALAFLGIGAQLDGARFQSNFQQSILQIHQMVGVIASNHDLDGDGEPDVDGSRIGYAGISLGAIVGTGVLAVNDEVDAAVLQVGGGNLHQVLRDGELLGSLTPLLESVAGSPVDYQLMLSVTQSALDPGDAGLLATSALHDGGPDVLVQLALHDTTVPPSSGRALALGLGVEQRGDVFDPIPTLRDGGGYPVRANMDFGSTAAVIQFDAFDDVLAGHDNTPQHPLVLGQAIGFLDSWAHGAVVIDAPD